jgi:hypothetical protein
LYQWRKDGVDISNATAATYDPPAEAANTSNASVTYTYTRWAKDDGTCAADYTQSTNSWKVTVYPVPKVNALTSQSVCLNTATAAFTFATTITTPALSYAWTCSNTAINLAASGTGDIAAFSAKNAGTANISATISVTPRISANTACTGTAVTATITVYP